MSVIFVVVGALLISFAARVHRAPEFSKPVIFTGPIGGLILIAVTLSGLAAVLYGLIALFS